MYFQFCFFISLAYSYCIETKPVKKVNYPIVVERSAEMIARYEGLALQAYPDTRGWSIGYGTRSYAGEVITKQEAYRRMIGIVEMSVSRVMRDFPHAKEDTVVAMTSLFYNCYRTGYLRVKKDGFDVMYENGFCQPSGYSGLVARRAEERKLIFGK